MSTGKNGPANQNRLCVKGRFGFDYVDHPQRLTKPMIRKDGVPKHADDELSTRPIRGRISARRPGTRRSTAPPRA